MAIYRVPIYSYLYFTKDNMCHVTNRTIVKLVIKSPCKRYIVHFTSEKVHHISPYIPKKHTPYTLALE
jgi:hypothetical protein